MDWLSVVGTAIVVGGTGACVWYVIRRRLFVRTSEGFYCVSKPWSVGMKEYLWEDVEWIGVSASYTSGESSVFLKLRGSRHPVSLLSSGDREAVLDLLVRWGGDRWRAAAREKYMPMKFVRVA